MQTDNLYLSEGDFGDPEVSAICDAILRVKSSILRMRIELAHERIYRVHANDIRVVYPIRGRTRHYLWRCSLLGKNE